MNVAVLGAGGVGGLVGGLLARAGHRVIFLARDETVRVLRDTGLRVRSGQFGDFTVAVEADTELRAPVDACLITVKHTSLEQALHRVSPPALGDGLIVPFLNGIEHPALLRERYRPELVVPGTIQVESTRIAPGEIVHGSPFAKVALASATAPRERVDALAEALGAVGITTQTRDDETATLWGKLFLLAPFALMTTCYEVPIGGIRTEHRTQLHALLGEIAKLSEASGVPADLETALSFFDTFQPEAKSSMQRDAEAGRPLELDAIGGALLRVAARHDIATPILTQLVTELRGAWRST